MATDTTTAGATSAASRRFVGTWVWWVLRGLFFLSLSGVAVGLAAGLATPGAHGLPAAWRLWGAALITAAITVTLVVRDARTGVAFAPWSGHGLTAVAAATGLACALAPVRETAVLAYVGMVAVLRSRDLGRRWLALVVLPSAGHAYLTWRVKGDLSFLASTPVVLIILAAVVEGLRRRSEAQELEAAQAVILARERARAEEARSRTDLAGEVHDVLAHSLSGLVVSLEVLHAQAEAEGSSPLLRERIEAASGLARDGLSGARSAVEALRAPTYSYADRAATVGSYGVDEVATALAGRLTTATQASIRVQGSAVGLPPGAGPAAEAVVREGLTNSLRHAPGLPVEVLLSPTGVEVYTCGALEGLRPTTHVSGHHGLVGLRRKVEDAGGRLTAGPCPTGWRVRADWTA